MPERLQKLIARAGIASRRQAELLIQSGAVRVNGEVVKTLGTKADPAVDDIRRIDRDHRRQLGTAVALENRQAELFLITLGDLLA